MEYVSLPDRSTGQPLFKLFHNIVSGLYISQRVEQIIFYLLVHFGAYAIYRTIYGLVSLLYLRLGVVSPEHHRKLVYRC